jgi:hypothetical protein
MRKVMRSDRVRLVCGWTAVAFSTGLACFWAFWGIIENFHEGWYGDSALSNIGLMFVQYLSPMLVFLAIALVSIRWHRIGGVLHATAALGAICFFRPWFSAGATLIAFPLFFIGLLYFVGLVRPLRVALALILGLPLIVLVACGLEPAIRVSGRTDDGNRGMRVVEGNGVRLVWASQGPGWPDEGVPWPDAKRRCRYLSADGSNLADTPQDVWRLPTLEEAVKSMARHGQNCGGVWDSGLGKATYLITPDKESPLWNTRSKVIYWWTATEVDEERAYMIVYDGKVWPRQKRFAPAYFGFRAVRNLKADDR